MKIAVVATESSGSIKDWGKTPKIVPCFAKAGFQGVRLSIAHSHQDARELTRNAIENGYTHIISAGGSGTINSVLEGCIDSRLPLDQLTLGFLRKGSADLVGKAMHIPDDIERAVAILAESIHVSRTVACDVIEVGGGACNGGGELPHTRHAIGFAGAEIFGLVPRYTENRFVKYYKGILGQLFGDLGPFAVGVSLAISGKALKSTVSRRSRWRITVDGTEVANEYFSAFIVVNGDLGPNLPLARGKPLGSGEIYLFALRDLGRSLLPSQLRHVWNASVLENPERYGLITAAVMNKLALEVVAGPPEIAVNIDGLPWTCRRAVQFRISGSVRLLAGATPGRS